MLCVWPEIVNTNHWLDNVKYIAAYENFVLKSIMLDVANKVFIHLSGKEEVILRTNKEPNPRVSINV